MRLSDPSVDPVSDEEIATGERAAAYVNDLIQGPALPERARSWQENVALGTLRLARMRRFLERVGNPHAGLRIVHVGGTSGKGSVAAKVAAGLTAAGYRTGLHVSPYLQTPLEKFVLDGRLGRPRELVDLVAWIRPHVDAFARADRDGAPTYGMVWVALTFEYFRRAATDVLVLEVGAGGRFDLTNVVHPVLAVVTAVGLDHTKTLGDRLEDIAWHKAGIYKSGVPAMAGATPPEALAVLTREAERVGAPFEHAGLTAGPDVRVANTALALAALARLRSCGFARLRPAALAAAAEATLPGRFERMPGLPATVLDGAHNRDKAQALARLLPGLAGGRPVYLVAGVVGYRSAEAVLAPLLPIVRGWIATEPQVHGKPPLPAADVAATGAALGVPAADVVPSPLDALERARTRWTGDALIGVTGSLYLVGNVRTRWYPTNAIVRQRTMWLR